jgi:hypothetical protein
MKVASKRRFGIAVAGWLNNQFGVLVPWEKPHFLLVCERRYDAATEFPLGQLPNASLVVVSHHLLRVPLEIPALKPDVPSAPFAGCPSMVVLDYGDKA